MRRGAWLAAFLALAPGAGRAETIKVATWNLDWLTLRHAGDPALPDEVKGRAPADFAALARYARRLGADVVGLEEVDGPAPAALLFPASAYQVVMTNDDVVQRVGLAVRRGIAVERHDDLRDLDVEKRARHRLRSGLDVTLRDGDVALRVLVVHLKSGCWSADEDREGRRACADLDRQIPVLAAWIAARRAEGGPFLVIGDFNRRLQAGDRVLAAMDAAAPLVSAAEGLSSPCWGGGDFIDDVLAGGPAAGWMERDSLRVMVYRGADPAGKDRLSDHCPVSVRLSLPGDGAATAGSGSR